MARETRLAEEERRKAEQSETPEARRARLGAMLKAWNSENPDLKSVMDEAIAAADEVADSIPQAALKLCLAQEKGAKV